MQWQLSNWLVLHREAIFPWLRLRLRHLSLLREFQWSSTSPTERSFSVLSAMTSLTPLVLSTASSSFRYSLRMRFRNFEMQFSFKFSYRPNGFSGRRWTNAPRYRSHRTLQVLSLSLVHARLCIHRYIESFTLSDFFELLLGFGIGENYWHKFDFFASWWSFYSLIEGLVWSI